MTQYSCVNIDVFNNKYRLVIHARLHVIDSINRQETALRTQGKEGATCEKLFLPGKNKAINAALLWDDSQM